jgi:hypothetical protein
MRPRLRQSLSVAAAAASLLIAGTAAAQFDAGTTTTFAAEDFFIGVQHEQGANLSDFDIARFFNKANCDCDTQVFVYVALTNSGFAKRTSVDRTGNIEFWVGTDCANTSLRDQRCLLLNSQTMAAYVNAGRNTIPTTARVLSTYTGGGGTIDDAGAITNFTPNPTCTLPLESFDQTLWVLSNVNGTPVVLDSRAVHIDLTPPPPPDPLFTEVEGGEQALTITWQGVDSAVITDLLGYQVLCNRGGDLQVFSDGAFKPGYLTCPATSSGMGVQGLDPLYICSPLLAATARSYRIKILQNDITYGAAVVSIDINGNASVPDILYGTATKTKSFYDVYRNDDPDHPGGATGGYCALGSGTTSRAALTSLAAAIAIAGMVLLRRRRRR